MTGIVSGMHIIALVLYILLHRAPRHENGSMDLAAELQRIYDSEINVRIGWLWDGGIEVRLGDDVNGYLAAETLASARPKSCPGSRKPSRTSTPRPPKRDRPPPRSASSAPRASSRRRRFNSG
jgi:hypothetical protein